MTDRFINRPRPGDTGVATGVAASTKESAGTKEDVVKAVEEIHGGGSVEAKRGTDGKYSITTTSVDDSSGS